VERTPEHPRTGSRSATFVAVALVGAAIGTALGWLSAFPAWFGGSGVGSELGTFLAHTAVGGAVGLAVGAIVGAALAPRHPRLIARQVVAGTALTLGVVALGVVLFVPDRCVAYRPVSAIASVCTSLDHRLDIRVAFGAAAAILAGLGFTLRRRPA